MTRPRTYPMYRYTLHVMIYQDSDDAAKWLARGRVEGYTTPLFALDSTPEAALHRIFTLAQNMLHDELLNGD